jgi:hypothetical protein
MNYLQGDPKLILTEQGSKLKFTGGQPLMDQGLENLALISLFSMPGWAGNVLFPDANQKLNSDFLTVARQPVTISMLNDLREAAERALVNPAFGEVTVVVTNPNSYRLNVEITIEPPGQDIKILTLTKYGNNWLAQSSDPAYLKI